MLKFAAICIALGLVAGSAQADTLTFEPDHTSVIFQYPHFGLSHPSGKIMGAIGTLTLDHDDMTKSAIDITLDMTTLTTALPAFDTLLKGEKYFDIAQFPTAAFKSTQVELTGENTANITGDLTIHGVTKPVTLDVTLNQKGPNMMKKLTAGFTAKGTINRSDFGISTYVPAVSDQIDLYIEAEANAQ